MRAQKKMYRHMASWVAGKVNREGFQEEKEGQNEGKRRKGGEEGWRKEKREGGREEG